MMSGNWPLFDTSMYFVWPKRINMLNIQCVRIGNSIEIKQKLDIHLTMAQRFCILY